MDPNFYLYWLTIFERLLFDVAQHILGKFYHSQRVVIIQEALIDLLLTLLEPTAGHVGFPDCFNLLESVLFTELIEGIIDVVEPFAKLSTREHLHYVIEV